MKRWAKGLVEWRNYICLIFTDVVCIYAVIAWLCGEREIRITTLLQFVAISAIDAIIQGIAFSEDWVIKNMAYTKRMLLFVVMFLPVLAVFGWVFDWFPTDNLASWGIFLLIFFAVFIVMLLIFEIVFHLTGKKYAGLLGQYRQNHGQDEKERV